MAVINPIIHGSGSGGAVNSVNGKTGTVVLDAIDVNAAPQYDTMPEASANNEGEIAQYTGEPNKCIVNSYVNSFNVTPPILPTFIYNAETFATFLSDRSANPNTGTDIVFTEVEDQVYGGMNLKITYNEGQDEYVVVLEEEFPDFTAYPPQYASEYDTMFGALGFTTNYAELDSSSINLFTDTLSWMDNPDGEGSISLTLPDPSNYTTGYFYKSTAANNLSVASGTVTVTGFDGGDDNDNLPAPEPITFNLTTFNAYATSVNKPTLSNSISIYAQLETDAETGEGANIFIQYNAQGEDSLLVPTTDNISDIQASLASVGIIIDLTGFTWFGNLTIAIPVEDSYSWTQTDVQPSLPTTAGASAGQVLALDSNLNPVWVTPASTPATTPQLAGGAANWPSNTQTITVQGVTPYNTVFVAPAPTSSADYASAGILCTVQGVNELTFTCATVPSNDITLNIVIL